jgi:hypothetical protein
MFRETPLHTGAAARRTLAALTAVVALALGAHSAPAQTSSAGTDDGKRLRRDIAMMENIINDILVESRNVLVPSRDAAHGHYIPEFGILFTTEASLLNRWNRGGWGNWDNWDVRRVDGKLVITTDEDDLDEDDSESRRSAREEKKYTAFKEEMAEALLTGGDRLSRLSDNQWVGISVALESSEYFRKNKLNRYLIKARVGDLRAYGDGRITEAAARAKFVEEES